MEKRYLPSLIIFAKGMLITALAVFFKITDKPGGSFLFFIGGALFAIALIVLFIMYMIKPKK